MLNAARLRLKSAVCVGCVVVKQSLPSGFDNELKQQWVLASEQSQKAKEATSPTSTSAQAELQRKQEEDLRLAAEAEAQRQKQAQRSREEQRQREHLLEKYGFQTDAVDEEGNLIAGEDEVRACWHTRACCVRGPIIPPLTTLLGVRCADARQKEEYDIGFEANTNRTMVRELEKAQRAAAKEEHAKKVAREKELLAQQRMRKEQEKKRTQKRERRRGPG